MGNVFLEAHKRQELNLQKPRGKSHGLLDASVIQGGELRKLQLLPSSYLLIKHGSTSSLISLGVSPSIQFPHSLILCTLVK